MVKWFKCDEDNALTSKNADLLTMYFDTCNHGGSVPPPVPEELLLPPSDKELPPISLDDNEQSNNILHRISSLKINKLLLCNNRRNKQYVSIKEFILKNIQQYYLLFLF
jgi:hypothetical protein